MTIITFEIVNNYWQLPTGFRYSIQNVTRVVSSTTIVSFKTSGGTVNSLICDNNRTNQKFLKSFPTLPNKPWLTTDGLFMLFEDDNIQKKAKWPRLARLYQLESHSLLKLSKLNKVAIEPELVERQSIPYCLRAFCDETVTALLTHTRMKEVEGVHDTALFIKKVVTFWKIVNVKFLGEDVRRNDPLKAVISDPEDPRLKTIKEFGDMCKKMISLPGKRVKQLNRDTCLAMYGLAELSRHLLSTTHQYVALAKFTTDKFEKRFLNYVKASEAHTLLQCSKYLRRSTCKAFPSPYKHGKSSTMFLHSR